MNQILLGPELGAQTPSGFKDHVRAMFERWETEAQAKKKPPKVISVSKNKKGSLTFRIKRDPKWLSPEEVKDIAVDLEVPMNVVWNEAVKRKIRIGKKEEVERITAELQGLPW